LRASAQPATLPQCEVEGATSRFSTGLTWTLFSEHCSTFAENWLKSELSWRRAMARRKKRPSPEERAEREATYRETVRKLEERIAYHQAKMREEEAAKAGS
jgi:hypothetical protein